MRLNTNRELQKLLVQSYETAKLQGKQTPILEVIGPPGCAKTQTVHMLAEMQGVKVHVLSMARANPLELEGLNLPSTQETEDGVNHVKVVQALVPFWDNIKEGDIVLLDEFHRGHSASYNAIIDIITSRTVAGQQLPFAYFIAISNEDQKYDDALNDRLFKIHVPDIVSSPEAFAEILEVLRENTALFLPDAVTEAINWKIKDLLTPAYEKAFKTGSAVTSSNKEENWSVRKIEGSIPQQLPHPKILELIQLSNNRVYADVNQHCPDLIDMLGQESLTYQELKDAVLKHVSEIPDSIFRYIYVIGSTSTQQSIAPSELRITQAAQILWSLKTAEELMEYPENIQLNVTLNARFLEFEGATTYEITTIS